MFPIFTVCPGPPAYVGRAHGQAIGKRVTTDLKHHAGFGAVQESAPGAGRGVPRRDRRRHALLSPRQLCVWAGMAFRHRELVLADFQDLLPFPWVGCDSRVLCRH
jgi:hypothetical protein